jgi:hypothetical protein
MTKMARQETASRHQGKDGKAKMARDARTQGIGNCHHRHAIIGMACHRQGKGRKDARHRHAIIGIIGIGMPSSACHRHAIIGSSRTQQQDGRTQRSGAV